MSYAQFNSIEAADYNNLVGGNPVTSSGKLNTVWATGGGSAGYGQTAEANVSIGTTVAATKWANLVNFTANSASHQGTSITSVTPPSSGGVITYISSLSTNLTSIYNSRLNAASQGSTVANAVAYGSTWGSVLTFTHTITFANGDAARYFFNAGGQLKLTCSHANNAAGINLLFNGLAANVGTVALSAPSSGTITVVGTSYSGITKVGGGDIGNTTINSVNSGYYGLTTGNVALFTQKASTGPAGYLSTTIQVIGKTNGAVGSNNDNGNVITLYTVWDEVPNGLTVGTGSTTTLTVVPPATTYIANSWGTITLSGTATGV